MSTAGIDLGACSSSWYEEESNGKVYLHVNSTYHRPASETDFREKLVMWIQRLERMLERRRRQEPYASGTTTLSVSVDSYVMIIHPNRLREFLAAARHLPLLLDCTNRRCDVLAQALVAIPSPRFGISDGPLMSATLGPEIASQMRAYREFVLLHHLFGKSNAPRASREQVAWHALARPFAHNLATECGHSILERALQWNVVVLDQLPGAARLDNCGFQCRMLSIQRAIGVGDAVQLRRAKYVRTVHVQLFPDRFIRPRVSPRLERRTNRMVLEFGLWNERSMV